MCDSGQDGNWEADDLGDFSRMNSRLDSFRGSGLAKQVSPERLARAGFYFTGQADRVRCFSCQRTVENWCKEDTPVERHKEVSPTCKFLSCTNPPLSFSQSSDTRLTNGSTYNEEAEDMEYRLRTGEVVDESTYPMVPHMRSEQTRLQTFSSWPPTAPVRPRDLAEAGFYYLGEDDRVQCFCCAGMLNGWEAGDTPWEEHNRHYQNCIFILGHDVGNVPLPGGMAGEGGSRPQTNSRAHMESFDERLCSFAGIQHPVDHERLARAGFYSTGTADKVLCFCCGGGLKGWQPEEDPWEEHAKHYPGCRFLLAEKGQEFVNSVQLQSPRQNGATSSHQNGFSGERNGVLRAAMAQEAMAMGIEPSVVEKSILEKISRTGVGYSSLEELMEDCQNTQESNPANSQEQEEDPLEKLRKLQMEKLCKICMDRDICIVLIPCGHLVTCKECSLSLIKCPICCGAISQKVKTYIA